MTWEPTPEEQRAMDVIVSDPTYTKQEIIDMISKQLWLAGMGSKQGGRIFATTMVNTLIVKGNLKVKKEHGE